MRRTLSFVLCIAAILCLFVFPSNAKVVYPHLDEFNIVDDGAVFGIKTKNRNHQDVDFGYSLNEGEVVILIAGVLNNGNVREILESELLVHDKVKAIYLELGVDYQYYKEHSEDYWEYDVNENIEVLFSDKNLSTHTIVTNYAQKTLGKTTYAYPFVVIIQKENGKNVIKYADSDYTTNEELLRGTLHIIIPEIEFDIADAYAEVHIKGTRLYDEAAEVHRLLNIERKKAGLKELKYSKELTELAMIRAAELQIYFSHTRPNDESCFTIDDGGLYSAGYANAENIALNHRDAAQVMEGWMNSPGHKNNILNADSESVGVGAYVTDEGMISWVQFFGTGESEGNVPKTRQETNETVLARPDKINLWCGQDVYEIDKGKDTIFLTVYNQNATVEWAYASIQDPVVEIADKNIVKYDSITGKITGLKAGTTKATIKVFEEQTENCATVTIIVRDAVTPGDNDDPHQEYKFGDVNGDGKVNASDYQLLKRIILKTAEGTDEIRRRCDITGDGSIRSNDYMMLKRIVLKTI